MKYIKTKDGIFEVVKEDGDWLEIISNFERKMQCHCVIKKHAIIKQADTIEELCDEFVWVTPEQEHRIKPKTGDGLWYLCCDYKDGHQIYGAIWTDKGLQFVALMNSEGVLELI